jgi:hypothetical protein
VSISVEILGSNAVVVRLDRVHKLTCRDCIP